MPPDTPSRPTKGDIINRLIQQFGLRSYLEYNKFDGASYYDGIVCPQKELAYLPEHSYLDADNLPRLLNAARDVPLDMLLPLPQLLERYEGKKFDLVFIDPVHVRPDVDMALRTLPRLLNPDGILAVHDCNPEHVTLTSLARRPGSWVGETYKAFTLFRAHNRDQTTTVSEDFGVGLIWNINLNLDYPLDADIDYFQFAANREEYIGLIDYPTFLARTQNRIVSQLFRQPPRQAEVIFTFKPVAPGGQPAPQPSGDTAEAGTGTGRPALGQLFWRTAQEDFSERNSQETSLSFNGAPQRMAFVFPASARQVSALRFDFADRVGTVRLEALHLKDGTRDIVWRWAGSCGALGESRNTVFHDIPGAAGAPFMRSTNADPHVFLDVPKDILSRIEPGWMMEVQMVPQIPIVHGLLAELAPHGSAPAPAQTFTDAHACAPESVAAASAPRQVFWQQATVGRAQREQRLGQKPMTVWFTGLSGAGKTTLANAVESALHALGHATYLLDGDNIRHGLCHDLGFSETERAENMRRVGEVARLMVDAGLVVLASFISPSGRERAAVRARFEPGEFAEVYVSTPIDVCEQRDTKGLYKLARAGKLGQFTGISAPYDAPQAAELTLDTSLQPLEDCVGQVVGLVLARQQAGSA